MTCFDFRNPPAWVSPQGRKRMAELIAELEALRGKAYCDGSSPQVGRAAYTEGLKNLHLVRWMVDERFSIDDPEMARYESATRECLFDGEEGARTTVDLRKTIDALRQWLEHCMTPVPDATRRSLRTRSEACARPRWHAGMVVRVCLALLAAEPEMLS